jgi:hypothetical protein
MEQTKRLVDDRGMAGRVLTVRGRGMTLLHTEWRNEEEEAGMKKH